MEKFTLLEFGEIQERGAVVSYGEIYVAGILGKFRGEGQW